MRSAHYEANHLVFHFSRSSYLAFSLSFHVLSISVVYVLVDLNAVMQTSLCTA